MIRVLIENWWLLLLRGTFAIAFALSIVFLQPFFATLVLQPWAHSGIVVVFALLAIVTGVITIIASLRGSQRKHHPGMMLAEGIALTSLGGVVLLVPQLLLWEVIRIIGCSVLLAGALEIAMGFHLRRHIADEWLLLAGGATSMAFGVYLLSTQPNGAASSVLNWIALYAFVNGTAMAGLGFRLHGLLHSVHTMVEHEKGPEAKSATHSSAA